MKAPRNLRADTELPWLPSQRPHPALAREPPCRSGQVGEGVCLRLDVQFRDGKYLANVKPLFKG